MSAWRYCDFSDSPQATSRIVEIRCLGYRPSRSKIRSIVLVSQSSLGTSDSYVSADGERMLIDGVLADEVLPSIVELLLVRAIVEEPRHRGLQRGIAAVGARVDGDVMDIRDEQALVRGARCDRDRPARHRLQKARSDRSGRRYRIAQQRAAADPVDVGLPDEKA